MSAPITPSPDPPWKEEVITRLTRIETKLDLYCEDFRELEKRVNGQGRDVARLQVKAGLYGTLAGAATAAIGWLLK